MAVEELLEVVVPPKHPVDGGNVTRWREVERQLGTRLPLDLFDFATRYGSGRFAQPFDLEVLNPFAVGYPTRIHGLCGLIRSQRWLPDRPGIPYGVFPDQPGWLPWGFSDGDFFCWVTEGEPTAWPLLLISDHGRSFQQLQLPMTSFLARLFTKQLQPFFVVRNQITFRQPARFVASRPPEYQPSPAVPHLPTGFADGLSTRCVCPWDGEWLPPDALGRPTGARVVIGPGSYSRNWNGFAPEAFTVYPAWWHELPHPRRRWRRGQLLGWQLGGPAGTALYNLIPLTWRAQTLIWDLEGAIAAEVTLGARVIYSVSATYEGTNHHPSRVTLESARLAPRPESGRMGPLSIDNT